MDDIVKVQRNVTYAAAVEALRAALAKAEELGVGAGVVVTDTRGEIVAAGKTERAGAKAWRGGLLKATAAAGLGRSTEEFLEKRLKQDEVLWRAMSANPETFLVPGGVPLIYDGVAVGAVGVSGGHYADDAKVAQAGADRFAELAADSGGGSEPVTATDDAEAVHFDHHSSAFAADPWPELADLRHRCPVARSDRYDGFWVVTRYDDIRRVALDDEAFSSAETILIPPKKNAQQKSIPIEMDPPEFLEYRRLLHPMFSPAATDRLEPVIEYFVHRCIDEFVEHGEVDFVHDFASPLPAMVTLHKLGMPVEDWRRFSEPMHKTVFLRQDNPQRAGVLEELAWIAGTIRDAIADRRAVPRDDMITYLVQGEVGGAPVTDHAVGEMVMLTLQGGLDTTGSAISSALIHLDRDRDARQRLIDEPDLLPSAVEEFLRYESPQFALARTATRDVVVGERQIRQGDRVLLVWASGNRDEEMFDQADEVVLDRSPNRHMAFGLGAHRCLGSNFARRQILLALRAVLRRLPDYTIDHEHLVKAETIGVTYGTFALPARFTAGPRVLM